MPQLDPHYFATQLFWLVVSFVVLYLLMSRLALPGVKRVLKKREEKISGDLAQAQQLKDQAEQILQAYQQSLAQARSEAQRLQREAADAATAEAARQHAAIAQRIGQQVSEAERNISAQRDQAIAGLRAVATEVAQAALARLTGATAEGSEVAAAVERNLGLAQRNLGGAR